MLRNVLLPTPVLARTTSEGTISLAESKAGSIYSWLSSLEYSALTELEAIELLLGGLAFLKSLAEDYEADSFPECLVFPIVN